MAGFSDSLRADFVAYSNAPAEISTSLSSNLGQLKVSYDAIKTLIPSGGLPIYQGYVDPGESIKFVRSALTNYSTKFLSSSNQLSSDVIDFIATAGAGGGLNLRNPALMEIANVASQVTGTAFLDDGQAVLGDVAKSMGLTKLGASGSVGGVVSVTETFANALSDGHISPEEGKAIASAVCSFAGSAMGLTVGGVAGPIGAAVGMVVGFLVDAFTSSPPPPVVDIRIYDTQAAIKQRQTLFDQLAAKRQEVVNYVRSAEASYWANLDKFFALFADSWAKDELALGFRFGLRWFDDATGPAFYLPPVGLQLVGARWKQLYSVPTQVQPSINEANFQTFVVGNEEVTRCLLPMCGCPYPAMMVPLPTPKQTLPTGAKTFSDGYREAKAFATRGVIWVPPEQRLNPERYVPYPNGDYLDAPQQYLGMLERKQREVQVKVAQLQSAQVLLQADLMRTSAVMKSYVKIMANRARYRVAGVGLGDGQLASFIESRYALLNNSALLAGLGVLGYSVWRAVK